MIAEHYAVASVLAPLMDKDTEPNAKAESLERKLVAENETKAAWLEEKIDEELKKSSIF
ncbi:MAG: hypothetical protein K2G87_06695 [Oscillospiraceae bacterium]|nr:hypothetical protein [Oscillospiraceae bacterium]